MAACVEHGGLAAAAPERRGIVGPGPQPEPLRPALELAEVFRRQGDSVLAKRHLTFDQVRVVQAILRCRTAELGGYSHRCQACGHLAIAYNPCRNRHCPKCQGPAQYRWVRSRLERVLPSHYFHLVFTLPGSLRGLVEVNRRLLFELLLSCAGATLLALGRDPARLGGRLGVTAVLHTWTRDLRFHPHVHCIVTGGGLSLDASRWVRARPRYLFPGAVLAALIRGKFLAGLAALHRQGRLRLAHGCAPLAQPGAFQALLARLYRTRWVVYAKRPFAGPAQVIAYLGRYTHRVAISNHRLVAITPHSVRFRTRGTAEVELPAGEFIHRFLQHVLPSGFVKIRHYGLMASRHVNTLLARARTLLTPPDGPPLSAPKDAPDSHTPAPVPAWLAALLRPGPDPARCPVCGSADLVRLDLPRQYGAHIREGP